MVRDARERALLTMRVLRRSGMERSLRWSVAGRRAPARRARQRRRRFL